MSKVGGAQGLLAVNQGEVMLQIASEMTTGIAI